MPTHSHAYARGYIYQKRPALPFPYSVVSKFIGWCERQKAQIAHRQFRKYCTVTENLYLGPNAWCVNYGEKEDVSIGNHVYCRGLLRCGSRGNGSLIIEDEVYIGDDTIISAESKITISSLVMISHGVHIFDSTGHPTDPDLRETDWRITMKQVQGPRPDASSKPIHIGRRAWIGFNSIILRGVTIGEDAIVAAGSVVVKDVEPRTVVAGNPAVAVKKL